MKIIKSLSLIVVLLLSSLATFAQCDPGDGAGPTPGDPDYVFVPCPLDTWVILLFAVALIFTVLHLYRKQKHALTT